MNLREQFEKETGWNATDWNTDSPIFHPKYVEWLEQRNKEQVEVLKKAKMLHHIVNSSRLRDMDIDDFLTEDEEIFDALLDLEQAMRKLNIWDS